MLEHLRLEILQIYQMIQLSQSNTLCLWSTGDERSQIVEYCMLTIQLLIKYITTYNISNPTSIIMKLMIETMSTPVF